MSGRPCEGRRPLIHIPLYTDLKILLARQVVGLRKLARMEIKMATLAERFDALDTKVDDIKADFKAFKDALETNDDTLSAEAEAALARLEGNVGSLDTEVGDADGSDVLPGDETPTQPL